MSSKGPRAGEHTVPDSSPDRRPLTGDFLLVAGEGRLSSHALSPEVVIGRGDDCDLVLANRGLSRRHAILRVGPPMTIQDLGSTNGTRVGTETLRGGEPVAIAAGDSIHVGPFTLVVVARSNPDDESASWRDLLRVTDPTV